ncbi:hypothetical protein [Polynucleobacter sp.]|uniref:hypothetical protein n=1 Tax=Polynucleobacter sp. TaxID=2029855 RepID=UPI003F69522B
MAKELRVSERCLKNLLRSEKERELVRGWKELEKMNVEQHFDFRASLLGTRVFSGIASS